MILLVILAVLSGIGIWAVRRPVRRLKHGQFLRRHSVRLPEAVLTVEEVQFADYQQALSQYFKLLDDVQTLGETLEVKYDYLDWTNTVLRFPRCTVWLVRQIDKVRLVQSDRPLPIAEFERLLGKMENAKAG